MSPRRRVQLATPVMGLPLEPPISGQSQLRCFVRFPQLSSPEETSSGLTLGKAPFVPFMRPFKLQSLKGQFKSMFLPLNENNDKKDKSRIQNTFQNLTAQITQRHVSKCLSPKSTRGRPQPASRLLCLGPRCPPKLLSVPWRGRRGHSTVGAQSYLGPGLTPG